MVDMNVPDLWVCKSLCTTSDPREYFNKYIEYQPNTMVLLDALI